MLSECPEGLSTEDLNRSLVPSFFGFMSLAKALAPIQWFFLLLAYINREMVGYINNFAFLSFSTV